MERGSKLQIVVNDEIIDLRNHDFEECKPYKLSHTSTKSSSRRTLNTEEQKQTANGLRKLANTLYNSTSPPILQKHKNIIRNRQKTLRAYSADPRFRREKSPPPESKPAFCRSESNVGSYTKSDNLKATQSAHSITKEERRDVTKTNVSKQQKPQPIIELKQLKKIKELCKQRKKPDRFEIFEPHFNYNLIDETDKSVNDYDFTATDTLVCKPAEYKNVVEQGTMTDDCNDLDDNDTCVSQVNGETYRSCYESAESESHQYDYGYSDVMTDNLKTASITSPVVSSDFKISRDINPYWNDPRLLNKYPKSPKPIKLRATKSSWTLPLSNGRKMLESTADSSMIYSYSSNVINTYKYDNATDIDEGSMNYETAKLKLWEALWKNYHFTPFFLLGSLCGLGLVAVLGWMLASDFLWIYFFPTKKDDFWYSYWIRYFAGGALHALENAVKVVAYVLLVPRQEIFHRDRER